MKGYVHDRTVRALVRRSEGNKLKSTILRQQLMSSDPLGSCLHLNGLEKLPSLPSSGVDSRGTNVDAVVKTRATVNDELSSKWNDTTK
jgi:hypothetical protein